MQCDPLRVFVGTSPEMVVAERVLEHSIRSRTDGDVEITWMRAGEGIFDGWAGYKGRPGRYDGWYTPFSGFRFAIPELAGFQHVAIYLDVDMIVLRDLRELLGEPRNRPWSTTPDHTDVSVIECSAFAGASWWPTIEQQRRATTSLADYVRLLDNRGMRGQTISARWNCLDGQGLGPATCLLHFNAMPTQPWKPFPAVWNYPPHPSPAAMAVWELELAAANAGVRA